MVERYLHDPDLDCTEDASFARPDLGQETVTAKASEALRAERGAPRPPLGARIGTTCENEAGGTRPSRLERVLTEGATRWAAAFALVLALHVGAAAYLLVAAREALEATPGDAIDVELMPNFSTADAKLDDGAGPEVPEQPMPTSDKAQADDPDPPAPDAPPPTEAEKSPETAHAAIAPPTPDARAELQARDKPEDRHPEEKPPVEKTPDAKPDAVEQKTAPSQASAGTTAQLGGGRRPSPAAQKSWRGDIGQRLVQKRRYPQEARNKGWQGIARVRVTIDGNGHVLGRALVKSSGKPVLDDEALELMQRSDPFPKPPEGMPVPIVMTVPVSFAIR